MQEFFWQFNLLIGIKLWPFQDQIVKGGSIPDFRSLPIKNSAQDGRLAGVLRFKTSGSGEHWGLRLNRTWWKCPNGERERERERERAGFRFQSDLVPGTRLWNIKREMVMEIFYKPGTYSISIGQRIFFISEPTKPAIFDFVQGAFHS